MHVDVAAALAVAHLDPKAEQVAQLTLQRFQIGIHSPTCRPFRSPADVVPGSGADFLRQVLRLADGQVAFDNLVGQSLGVRCRQDGTSVPHADIASQKH